MRTWDLLCPTFFARTGVFLGLLDQLEQQIRPGVRLVCERGERNPAEIAAKQQRLLEASDADYVSLLGDDTLLHPNFIEWVHDAMQSDPDVIGFKLQLWGADGPWRPPQHHSIAFHGVTGLEWHAYPVHPQPYWGLPPNGTGWCDLGGWMPVKRSIAIQASYTAGLDPNADQDAHWTRQVLGTGLLFKEVYFNEVLVKPQILDPGFHGEWAAVEATPHPERPFVTYI
jgi:hypothetical protein